MPSLTSFQLSKQTRLSSFDCIGNRQAIYVFYLYTKSMFFVSAVEKTQFDENSNKINEIN